MAKFRKTQTQLWISILLLLSLLLLFGCSDDHLVNYDNWQQKWDVEVTLGNFTVPPSMYDSLPGGQRYLFSSPNLDDPSLGDISWSCSAGSIYSPSNIDFLIWDAPKSGPAEITLEVADSRSGEWPATGALDLNFEEIGPRLTTPISSFDFGFVPQHSVISYGFPLFSTGGDMLRVFKIVPG